MIRLYYHPYSRATRVRWMLEELGEPYELIQHDFEADDDSRLREVHPLGKLPAIEDGSLKLFESGAILMYLADKQPSKGLAPAPGTPERAQYYQWIFYAMTEVEPHLVEFYEQTERRPEAERSAEAVEAARKGFQETAGVLDRHVADKEFLVGGRFSAADVILASMLSWAKQLGVLEGLPNLLRYGKNLGARPANKRSRAE